MKKGAVKISEVTIFLVIAGLFITAFSLYISEGAVSYGTTFPDTYNQSFTNIKTQTDTFQEDIRGGLVEETSGTEEKSGISAAVNLVDKAFTATVGIIKLVTKSFGLITFGIGEFATTIGIPGWAQTGIVALLLIAIGWGIAAAWMGL